MKWKNEEPQWTPPLKCRVFGHRFRETAYTVNVIAFLETSLYVCEKCGGGRHQKLGAIAYSTPQHVQEYVRRQEMKAVPEPERGVLVEGVFPS